MLIFVICSIYYVYIIISVCIEKGFGKVIGDRYSDLPNAKLFRFNSLNFLTSR